MKKKDLDDNAIGGVTEDIFNETRNQKVPEGKTKFILLSIIIAIIIIIILIITVWILTRDTNVQIPVEESKAKMIEKSNSSLSESVKNGENPNIYSPDMNKPNDTNNNIANAQQDDTNTENDNNFDFSNDPKFQAILSQQKNGDMLKQDETFDVPSQLVPKSSDTNQAFKEEVKKPEEKKDSKKIASQDKTSQKATPEKKGNTTSDINKQEIKKDNKKLEIKDREDNKEKLSTNLKGKEIKKPSQTNTNTQQGKIATKGHYLQVGAFNGEANKIFLDKISKYSYRIEKSESSNNKVTKYLIGPYPSRVDAMKDIQKINTTIGKAFYKYVD